MGWGEVLGSMGAGVIAGLGQQQTNRSNETIAKDATASNIEEAKRNREFQERMSNTAHQREIEDLRKAGLNPILSANKGGASTPSGATGSAATTHLESAIGAGLAGAKDAITTKKGLDIQNEQLGLIQAQKGAANATTAQSLAQGNKLNTETELIKKTAPGVIAESDMTAQQAGHYMKNKDYYNTVKMVGEGLGVANSAKGVLTNWGPNLKNAIPKSKEPSWKGTTKDGTHYHKGTGEILESEAQWSERTGKKPQ